MKINTKSIEAFISTNEGKKFLHDRGWKHFPGSSLRAEQRLALKPFETWLIKQTEQDYSDALVGLFSLRAAKAIQHFFMEYSPKYEASRKAYPNSYYSPNSLMDVHHVGRETIRELVEFCQTNAKMFE